MIKKSVPYLNQNAEVKKQVRLLMKMQINALFTLFLFNSLTRCNDLLFSIFFIFVCILDFKGLGQQLAVRLHTMQGLNFLIV